MNRLQIRKLLAEFIRMRPRLQAALSAGTRSQATAEDLVQETWIKLESHSRTEAITNPDGLMTLIARHKLYDHLRKERRRGEIDAEVSELLFGDALEISPERTMIARERLRAVQDALGQLPERTRSIFLMNRIDGISHRKIAETLGISDEAVYYHIRRALERLAALRDEATD